MLRCFCAIFKSRKGRWGQGIPEYAIFIAVIVIAFVTMQAYFKRGLQSFAKVAADEIGYQKDSSRAKSDDPNRGFLIEAKRKQEITDDETLEQLSGGGITRDIDEETIDLGGAAENYAEYISGFVEVGEE